MCGKRMFSTEETSRETMIQRDLWFCNVLIFSLLPPPPYAKNATKCTTFWEKMYFCNAK